MPIKGLLTIAGIRFLFTSFVPNFQNFGVISKPAVDTAAEARGLRFALFGFLGVL